MISDHCESATGFGTETSFCTNGTMTLRLLAPSQPTGSQGNPAAPATELIAVNAGLMEAGGADLQPCVQAGD